MGASGRGNWRSSHGDGRVVFLVWGCAVFDAFAFVIAGPCVLVNH